MNPLTSKLMDSVIHMSFRVKEAMRRRLRNTTNAITDAIGAGKMNQR
jgi:hypothetical protein